METTEVVLFVLTFGIAHDLSRGENVQGIVGNRFQRFLTGEGKVNGKPRTTTVGIAENNLEGSKHSRGVKIAFLLQAFADNSVKKLRIAEQVASPESMWFLGEAVEPFQSHNAHPVWASFLYTGNIVKTGTCIEDEPCLKTVTVLQNPLLLHRHSHSDDEEIRLCLVDCLNQGLAFEIGEKSMVTPNELQVRVLSSQGIHSSFDHRGG